MLVDLGINSREVYENDFEKAFLSESATFYRQESQEFINSNCCADYMRKVEQVAVVVDTALINQFSDCLRRKVVWITTSTRLRKKEFELLWSVSLFRTICEL